MNRYTLMVERQKKELYELLGTMPAAYVYNESQLVEGLEKIGLKPDQADEACRVRNTGAIIRKSDAGRLLDLIQHHHNERVKAIEADSTGEAFIVEMFEYGAESYLNDEALDASKISAAIGLSLHDIESDSRLSHALNIVLERHSGKEA